MSNRKGNSSSEEELYENEKGIKGLRKRQQVKYYESSEYSSSEDDYVENVKKKPRLNKKSGNKSTSSDADDPSFESGDSDSEASYQKKSKSSSIKKEAEPLSEYEKQLLENKIKNQEFLKSIGMDKAKDDILELKPKRIQKKKVYSEGPSGPKRVSQREKALINYTEGEIGVVDLESETGSTGLTFKKLLKFKEEYEYFLEDFGEILLTEDFVRKPVLYDKDVLKQLSKKALLKPVKLTSPSTLSWYPSSEHLVLAIGNVSGNVSLWNVEDTDYVYKFAVHSKKVSRLQFNPSNTSHLISTSMDGTLFCCDMQEQKFTEVLRISNSCCTCFDFFSPSCYLVSLTNGGVVVVDKRSRGRGGDYYLDKKYTCHDQVINSIHVHPVEKNYFVTAGRDRKVCIWDLRKLSKLPIIENANYSKSVISASFSPLSGKYLLTTSLESKFCIYDTEKMTEGRMKLYKSVLKGFRGDSLKSIPVWLPNSDDVFTWQNKESKDMFQLYDKDLNTYVTLTDGMKGIRETIEFHSFKPAIASFSHMGVIRIVAEKNDT